jgi:hypothetical protein
MVLTVIFVSATMDAERHICAENGGLLMKKFNKILCTMLVLSMLVTLLPATAKAATKPKLNKTKVTLCVGQTAKLKVTNSDSTVTWKSSDPSVATVTSSGKVKGKKSGGTCTITATVGKKSVKCKVTVRKHSWKTVEETGHYEKVKTGEQNVIYCNCGEVFYTDADSRAHDPYNFHGYTVRTEPTYETKWVVAPLAYKECKYCKKIKS